MNIPRPTRRLTLDPLSIEITEQEILADLAYPNSEPVGLPQWPSHRSGHSSPARRGPSPTRARPLASRRR
jgi:hypothetical protein